MTWPFRRRLAGPPWEFSDAVVASVRDVAARNLLDQLAGQVRDLRSQVAQLENVQREHMARLREVVYLDASQFSELDAAALQVRRMVTAQRDREAAAGA
jgi:hypothetical protein